MKGKRKTLEELLDNPPTGLDEETLLVHSITRNTVEVRCIVRLTDPDGFRWEAERIVKIHMRRKEHVN